jgi:hypothetical protein
MPVVGVCGAAAAGIYARKRDGLTEGAVHAPGAIGERVEDGGSTGGFGEWSEKEVEGEKNKK